MSSEPILPSIKSYPKSSDTKWARMKPLFILLFILHFSLLIIQSCGLDIEDPTPPSPPQWMQKSLPEEWPERGIDAHESGGIYLEWESSPDEDIIAYNIYRAAWYDVKDSLGEYDLLTTLELESAQQLEYMDWHVDQRTRYYFKLKSLDGAANLSGYSDSLVYSILPAVPSGSMSPNGRRDTLGSERLLSWTYNYGIEMEDYFLTLLTDDDDIVTRVRVFPGNYVSGIESWQIPNEISLESDQVYKWRVDTGARYVDGYETAGSESHWAAFVYGGE
jgi:hypothetical protein